MGKEERQISHTCRDRYTGEAGTCQPGQIPGPKACQHEAAPWETQRDSEDSKRACGHGLEGAMAGEGPKKDGYPDTWGPLHV